MLLKHYLDRGVSKAELSRRFGVNRRTIHNWVDTGQLDQDLAAGARGYTPRPPVAHKLDPYKGIIDARLEAFPKLSAKRLFDEVRAAGYPGGYKRVLDYVRATRPREPVEAPVRFETPAGRQGQVDFGTFTLPLGPAPCPGGRPGILPAADAGVQNVFRFHPPIMRMAPVMSTFLCNPLSKGRARRLERLDASGND